MTLTQTTASKRRAAVLLEVLLALMLFAATAAIVTSSMNASMVGLDRLRLNTHAVNLATSVFAELELGQRAADTSGEQMLEKPFETWTCELALLSGETEAGETSGLSQIEVILRHKDSGLVYRQMQWLKLSAPARTAGLSSPNP